MHTDPDRATARSSRGAWLTRDPGSLPALGRLHARVRDEIVVAAEALRTEAAAERLRTSGLEALHEVLLPEDIGVLRERVLETLRNELLAMAVTVGRAVMGWREDFYVDDYLILRVNIPYEVARHADPKAENPGIGRLSPWMREIAASRRVVDPLYDPRGYHRGHPPAAWAHGPHLDSWAGHSKGGLNIWWAICDVPAEAGMVLYPELAEADLPCDRRTLYLAAGTPLPQPTAIPLRAGQMLIFDPEILHGTHLNVTGRTRVAVSLRLNAERPTFDPACFYAREFWRRASDIEAGRLGEVLHLKREDNLSAASVAPPAAPPSPVARPVVAVPRGDGPALRLCSSATVSENARTVIDVAGERILVIRQQGHLHAMDAACPHYGVDLSDGGFDGARLYCPACAVAFDIATGASASPVLTLRRYPVTERDGGIWITLDER